MFDLFYNELFNILEELMTNFKMSSSAKSQLRIEPPLEFEISADVKSKLFCFSDVM